MPTPTAVTPNSSPTIGGTNVRIDGHNFVAGATVLFGGIPATNVSVSGGGTVITCLTPSRPAGPCDIVVINPDDQSGTLSSVFTYSDPSPTISSVTPSTGPTTGGTAVTINGTNYLPGVSVRFGAMLANNVVVGAGGFTISCTSPTGASGSNDVIVTNPGGQSATRTGGFVYNNPVPTISSLTPLTGSTAGGTTLTILGTNFLPGATVRFGAMPASNVVVGAGGNSISCTSPAGSSGSCDVIVTNPGGQSATQTGGFTYGDPGLTITSLTPSSGTTAGGTAVTINGTNYLPGVSVRFGAMSATNVTLGAGGNSINCTSPANASGGYDVIVTNPGGQSATRTAGFVYSDPGPTINSLSPATGPTAGGTAVTISGTNFVPGATLFFGAMPANNVTVGAGGNSISCTSPANSSGGYDVIVTNPGGQSATRTGGFVYNDPAPSITSLTPAIGPTAGGTTVTISGTNFVPGATIRFGAMPANNVVVGAGGNSVTCTSPANSSGGYDVIITNPGGQSVTRTGGFVYSDPLPTISSLTPPIGPTAGGTAVTILGTNFIPGATVRFGTMPAHNVVVGAGGNSVTCTSPANATGGYDVIVTNPGGQSATRTGGFVYSDPAPSISSLAPPIGPTGGGTAVSISGTNFLPGATVRFGTMSATNVVVGAGGNSISCTSPANSSGGYDVIVTNPGGQSATRTGGFVYSDPMPSISSLAPSIGPTAGGTAVTISGANFLNGATIHFGAMPANNVVVGAGGFSISCTSPANSSGGYDVIVTNPGGQSATRTGGFVYNDPALTITSLSPSSGPVAGGTPVTVFGTNFLPGATVRFGAMPANNVVLGAGGNSISCTSPGHPVGDVDIVVFNPSGASATRSSGFTYV